MAVSTGNTGGVRFGELLRLLRRRQGLTQGELAKRAGAMHRTHIARIEAGDIAQPDPKTVEALAGALGVTVEYMQRRGLDRGAVDGAPAPGSSDSDRLRSGPFDVLDFYEHSTTVPLEAEVAAGEPFDLTVKGEMILVPSDKAPDPANGEYLLRVRGESMLEFGLHDGDYIVVERRNGGVAATGEIVVAWYNTGIVVKRWIRRGGRKILQAGNPDFPSYELNEDDVFELQGIVRRRIRIEDMPKISG